MIPSAAAAQDRYARLRVPVAIIAGEGDRMVSPDGQSARLHQEIPQSSFECLPGTGHMVHQTATPAVLAAIGRVTA
jgi:pimeloyl-ACP methyl ester carboxylesterase